MTLTGNGNVTNTVKLSPKIGARVICPDIVEPRNTVCATKPDTSQQTEMRACSQRDTYR